MKKIQKLLLIAAVTAILLPGCGKKEDVTEPVEPVVTEPVESSAPEEPLQEIVTDQVAPGEELPDGKKYSSLTGEIISKKVYKQRPLAIMLPTDKQAQPQYGIGRAGVLYECMEEGDTIHSILCRYEDLSK